MSISSTATATRRNATVKTTSTTTARKVASPATAPKLSLKDTLHDKAVEAVTRWEAAVAYARTDKASRTEETIKRADRAVSSTHAKAVEAIQDLNEAHYGDRTRVAGLPFNGKVYIPMPNPRSRGMIRSSGHYLSVVNLDLEAFIESN